MIPVCRLVLCDVQAAEEYFYPNLDTECLTWWWSGLTDMDDDGIWEWPESGVANYTDWHMAAVPNLDNFNCMQLLSATCGGKCADPPELLSLLSLTRWKVDDVPVQRRLHQHSPHLPVAQLILALCQFGNIFLLCVLDHVRKHHILKTFTKKERFDRNCRCLGMKDNTDTEHLFVFDFCSLLSSSQFPVFYSDNWSLLLTTPVQRPGNHP